MDTASPAAAGAAEIPAHAGASLILAGLVLAAANFLVVLDTTIANVSVPNIAGGLAVSTSDGTWVITSYAVAEAITVPLTGWLAARFGSVKVFVAGMAGFGLFSFLCGLAPSLGALVAFRVLQGLCGGPLIPLSQTLLLRVFPARHAAAATGLWAMTTLTAPIAGPILGGVLCDNIGWSSIFWINVPIAGVCAWAAWSLLRRCETPTRKARIDAVGLALLIVWVAALQTMLDLGKDRDWFQSATIVALGLTALIGFAAFVIWELTEANPIVDLRVFRHRGYSAAVFTLCIGFGAFFGTVVLTPLWLQQNLGYTATWAGLATAPLGVAAVMAAPVAAALSTKVDVRRLVCLGLAWMAFITLIRSQADSQMGFWEISRWLFAQGFGMPLFFVPLTGLALASVAVEETASAAGLMSFCRTFSGAIATSLVTTVWENGASRDHDDLSGLLRGAGAQVDRLVRHGFGPHQAAGIVNQLVQSQSVMLATNQVFMTLAILFLLACLAVWLAPRPTRLAAGVAAH